MKGRQGYKERTIICEGCGKTSTKRRPARERYCSLDCYRRGPRPTTRTGQVVTCEICGKEVYKYKVFLKHEKHFCSIEHANEFQKRSKVPFKCKICGKKGHTSPSLPRIYCSIKCRDDDPERQAQLLEMIRKQQMKVGPNKLEKAGYALLDSMDIEYRPQVTLADKFCVDALVSTHKLVIQFDGDYWHGNPSKFSSLDSRQKRRSQLDKSQDAYLRKCGFVIVRVWESDLKKCPEVVRLRLLDALAQTTPTPVQSQISQNEVDTRGK